MNTTLEPEILPVIIPVAELEKINATDAAFLTLTTEIDAYIESGQFDETAHQLTQVCVKIRTESDKIARRIAKPFGDKYDEIINYGKSIGNRAKALEDKIRPVKLAYEAEQTRIKEEETRKAQKVITDRIHALTEMNAVYDGNSYNVYGVVIDAIEVTALPDEEFSVLLTQAMEAYNAEQLRLEKIYEQQEAERERLADQQAMVAKQQAEQAKALQAQQEEINKKTAEIQRLTTATRKNLLMSHGFSFEESGFRYNNYLYPWSIENDTFDLVVSEMVAQQQRAEVIRIDAQEQAQIKLNRMFDRIPVLKQYGSYEAGIFYVNSWTYQEDTIADMNTDEFEKLIESIKADNIKRADDEAQELANNKVKQKELKERAKRLKNEKESILDWINQLEEIEEPFCMNEETMCMTHAFSDRLREQLEVFRKELDAL